MKVIIDIPEEVKTDIEDIYYTGRDISHENITTLLKTIVNGTPIPDNATNGDALKATFPNIEATEIKTNTGGYIEVKYLDTTDKCDATAFRKNWWNALYTER